MEARLNPWRRLLEKRAGGFFWLRVQTALVLALSFLAGALAGHLLVKAGLNDMRLRFPVVVLVSYGAFLGFVRLWLAFSGVAATRAKLDPNHVEPESEEASPAADLVEKTGEVANGLLDVGDAVSVVDAEGCLPAIGFALFMAVLCFLLAALWWLVGGFFGAASAALLEAGVEALAAISLARAAGGGAGSWMEGALRASWIYWLGLAVLSLLVAVGLHTLAPGATTFVGALAALSSG